MEDKYPPSANKAPVSPYRQSSNANNEYMQNTPHSVGAARAAKKAASDTSSGTSPFYDGALNWMNAPNTGTMPYAQDRPNTGTIPYVQDRPNTGTIPYVQDRPNTGTMPYVQERPNTSAMPYMKDKPNTGAMPYSAKQSNTGGVMPEMTDCDYKMGQLPPCAPLSAGFVPFQQKNPPKYSANDALTRGTLFPGLDLPYLNIANKDHPYAGTPLGELMALGFVIKELNLYLNTHSNDKDALMMLQSMNKLRAEGVERYVKMYGPITVSDIVSGNEYEWINNPWPWDYSERPVKDNV